MSNPVIDLLELLSPKAESATHFHAENASLGLPQIFGGQLMAQALACSQQQIAENPATENRQLHALNAIFLQRGDVREPLTLRTQLLREGKQFSQFDIDIFQQEKQLCRVTASYHAPEVGFEHQTQMPDAPNPNAMASENTLISALSQQLPEPMKSAFSAPRAFDVRLREVNSPFRGSVLPPRQQVWFRLNPEFCEALTLSSQQQQLLLTYFSDFHPLITALHPHARGFLQAGMQVATLNHNLWLHHATDLREWHLLDLDSPSASAARGFSRGQIFHHSGKLIASLTQEGLIRDTQFSAQRQTAS